MMYTLHKDKKKIGSGLKLVSTPLIGYSTLMYIDKPNRNDSYDFTVIPKAEDVKMYVNGNYDIKTKDSLYKIKLDKPYKQ